MPSRTADCSMRAMLWSPLPHSCRTSGGTIAAAANFTPVKGSMSNTATEGGALSSCLPSDATIRAGSSAATRLIVLGGSTWRASR
eukprot:9453211-Heterocapsa_arctica.AAC.1